MNRRLRFLMIVVVLAAAGSGPHGQTPKTGRMMRDKLAHAQRILEALTTSNYALLERESVALSQLTDSPVWAELKTPEYRGYTDRFIQAAKDLADAAKRRDLDGAATTYGTLTMTCYQCHRHLKDSRIAR
jgi:cytochrome c556